MHILIDYRSALRQPTGVGEYARNLVDHLVLQPCDTVDPDHITLFSSSWKDRFANPPAGVAVIDRRVPVRVLNLLWHRLEWPPIELLTGASFDVVHSLHPLLLPASRAAQVITIHDLDFFKHPERTEAEIRRDYPRLAPVHAARADRIVVPSRSTAADVQHHFGVDSGRITVCPNGAPDWPARTREPEDGYILFLGTLEPRKNIGTLLAAYELLLARDRRTPELVVAGRATPAANMWLERMRHPPLAGKARHIGYVAAHERQALYAGAAVFVLPSHHEGFGLPALEAMSIGVPVVAANRGALPEVVGDAGLLVDPDDARDLAQAIEQTIDCPDVARDLGARGRARSHRFTWAASARALREAYDQAVQTRRDKEARGP